jgi:glycosyltransferase involved in cell wall biosynthesis
MLNYEYPPVGGGAANATRYILREMVRSGQVQVDLVTSSAGRTDSVVEPEPGLRIHYLDVRKRSMHYWTHREIVTYLVRGWAYARRLMATGEFDCCHAMLGFPAGLIANLICRGRYPYIVSLRGSDVPGFNRRFAPHYHVLRPVFRRIWQSAAATVANSTGLRDLAIETDPTVAIDVIPNGIDLNEFSPADPAPAGPFRLVCVSRLIPRKAIDVLITAFTTVHDRFPDAELVIVGDGVLAGRLRDLAVRFGLADAVQFAGYQPHDKMAAFYRSAHMFVLPSRHEGMSNAMLEAMACGLPVVVTNTGGTAELVKDNGIVVSPDDPIQLATAILTLLDDENRRRHAAQASRTIARKFGWQSCARRYIETYREAVGRSAENERAVVATAT